MNNLLSFEKTELVNLENSLNREILSSTRAGGYMCTSIIGCNTRKYHGLLVCPIDSIDGENYVLLSTLDETFIENGQAFNLATHRYPGTYHPKGYKYIRHFYYAPTPTWIYRLGDIILKKEIIMVHESSQLLIRYTLEEATSTTTIRLRPMQAFRCRHKLSKANLYANPKYNAIDNGISSKMYTSFPALNMQLNKKNKFVADPNWYYNVEYLEEKRRGYPFQEDLYSLGYFEASLKKGESIVFSASLEQEKSTNFSKLFTKELSKRPPKATYLDIMKNSAQQFFAERGKDTEVIAGFPWFGRWGRDTFIALPGLSLAANYQPEKCKAVLDTMSREMNNGLFPNIGKGNDAAFNSVDAPMWYFWTIQKYVEATSEYEAVWKDYGKKMKDVMKRFREGVNKHIMMHDNGLIWAKEPGKALTWMDAIVEEGPVTPRGGYSVEVNALWYNAIMFMLELAEKNGDKKFVKEWKDMPELVKSSFLSKFWNDKYAYLADFVDENGQNMDLRSNQVIATSLPYTMLSEKQERLLLKIVEEELLTPRGLRSLSPMSPAYKGFCFGDQPTRDRAYHQGTIWVWQLGHYVEAMFKLEGKTYIPKAEHIVEDFSQGVSEYGLGGVAEIYDGNPPHQPRGSISQAWSVSEILRIVQMIEKHK